MAIGNDSVEFDIVVNGKPAKKSLKEVEAGINEVEKQDKKTTSVMKTNWTAVGAAVAAAAIAVGAMVNSAAKLDRAMFGLNEQTKKYIEQMGITSGLGQEVIAGFVQTGKAAGLSSTEIEKMVDMSVALGRAFPHESAETFADNLSMLSSTGEAQGYVVDILEQKYGTLDLKTISLADKMKVLEAATEGVNAEFENTAGSKFDQSMQKIYTSTNNFGNTLLRLADKSGILTTFNTAIDVVAYSVSGWTQLLDFARIKLKELIGDDVTQDLVEYNKNLQKMDELLLKITGNSVVEANATISIDKAASKNKTVTDLQEFQELVRTFMAQLRLDLAAGELTPEQLLFTEDAINEWSEKVQAGIARGLSMDQAMEATSGSLDVMTEELTDFEKELQSIGMRGVGALSDSFVDMAMTGKTSFSDMAKSMLEDIAKLIIKQAFLNTLKGTAFGGAIGLDSTHTGTSEVKHTGGSIGGGSNIPSYHTGMRTDERIAKLQVGEAVVNRAGAANNGAIIDAMNSGQKIGGGSSVNVTVINNAGAEVTTQNDEAGNITLILDAVANSITRGTGSIGTSMESRYGLSKR